MRIRSNPAPKHALFPKVLGKRFVKIEATEPLQCFSGNGRVSNLPGYGIIDGITTLERAYMKTTILNMDENHIDKEAIQQAAGILINGGLVAFPTETVYGLGANALSETAVRRIYEAKGRPSDNPLIVHIAHREDVDRYATGISEKARELMAYFWPGPLTLIFKRRDNISDFITGGLDTVAIRLPENAVARALIAAADLPIAAPSANRSGRPSPTRAKHVIEDLDGRVEAIIDGGKALIGLESTVVDMTGEQPVILRPGSVTQKMLESIIGTVIVDPALTHAATDEIPKSPGMKYKHYAPKGQLMVVKGNREAAVDYICNLAEILKTDGQSVAVIATKEDAPYYVGLKVAVIGSKDDPREVASNLFKVLRQMDEEGIAHIFTRDFSHEDIGTATMNRLMKAAGNKCVTV